MQESSLYALHNGFGMLSKHHIYLKSLFVLRSILGYGVSMYVWKEPQQVSLMHTNERQFLNRGYSRQALGNN